jgi:outer membrane protein insertion porin family
MKCIYTILLLAVVALFAACSNTKYLAPGQNLYMGATIKVTTTGDVSAKQKKAIKQQLASITRPTPNARMLGARFKLFVYNRVATPKKNKGFKYWLKYKVGEPPVIAYMPQLNKNSVIFQNRLENQGYFGDTVMLDTLVKNKKLTAVYTAYVGTQYTIRNVSFPSGDDTLSSVIRRFSKRTLLKKGDPYDLDVIKNERDRLDGRLKEKGFFYFSPDDLIMKVDSTVGDHKVDISVQIKPQTPEDATKPYRINDIVVYADYHLNGDTSLNTGNMVTYNGYKIIDSLNRFKPQMFNNLLVFKKDSTYNRTTHNLSLNRLVTLGVFRFVKTQFERVDTMPGNYLNAYYYLTPNKKKSIRLTATGLTKSDNATGGQLSVNWLNRNLFRGAEQLTVTPYIGLEQQFSSQQNAGTKRLGIDVALTIPRIISPFRFKINSGFVPKTRFQVGYQLFKSDTLYTLNSFTANYGYIWKPSLQKENILNLVNINYVHPAHLTPAFQELIDTNITLYRSIEPTLIISSSYNYNLNTQARANNKKNNFYLNINAELAGNLLGALTGANVQKNKQVNIFNVPFSQFARLEADVRHYYSLSKTTVLASRLLAGVGYSYGNSTALPFAKAFFAGGTNDIRAFRSRALGPGTYRNPSDTAHSTFLPQQPGDIKLEANIELRAKLFSVVHGALFIDAGNIWTQRADSARPGAQFSGNFLSQIAAGAGAGLRFDLTILVLRLDVAYPILKPYNYNLTPSKLVYNLAIGYPF